MCCMWMARILQGKVRYLGEIQAEASSVKITVAWNMTHEAVIWANLRLQNNKLLKNIRFLEDSWPCRNFKGISAIVSSVWHSGFFALTPLFWNNVRSAFYHPYINYKLLRCYCYGLTLESTVKCTVYVTICIFC